MLRRLSLIAAAAAMVALSALPASAATVHKLSFPSLNGVRAWGTYSKTSKGVRLNVCAEQTARTVFAVAAVAVGYNASYKLERNLGAVAIGYHQTVCRTGLVRYTNHLRIYEFIAGSNGKIVKRSSVRKVY